MTAGESPDRSGLWQRRGWWIAAGLLVLPLVVELVVLAVRDWVPWWWLAGGAGGVVLVVLWATGRLHQALRRPRLRELAGAAMVVGLVVLWVKAPDLYTTRDAEKSAVATATTRAGVLTLGAAIVVGLVAWMLLAETRRANTETLRLTAQGHLTDRYTKAIEQLGSGKLDVRLGGVYALERTAETSERDQRTVVEVLRTFVSGHSRPHLSRGHRRPPLNPERIATDVQAAIDVLLRLPGHPGLPEVQLDHAHLPHARLERANLSAANLMDADLSDTRLDGANLSDADPIRANLSGARLVKSNLSGARLGEANLSAANLMDADLSDTRLDGANLSAARLFRANLSNAWLSGADLSGARLRAAKGLTPQQLGSALGNSLTELPDGWQRPAHWSAGSAPPPADR